MMIVITNERYYGAVSFKKNFVSTWQTSNKVSIVMHCYLKAARQCVIRSQFCDMHSCISIEGNKLNTSVI